MAKISIIELMDDMHLSNQTAFKQYYSNVSDNNIVAVENLLNDNSDLKNQLTEADNMNKIITLANEREIAPKTDIDNYLEDLLNQFQDYINQTKVMGTFDQAIQYYIHNLVYYNKKGYYAYKNPPLGTLPTDTNYWLEYDITGLKGYGGINLNFKFAWQAGTQYQPMDCVYYINKLWFANQPNINTPPNLNHYPWLPIMFPMQPIRPQISTTQPTITMSNGDLWFKIIEGNDIVQTTWIDKAIEPTPRLASTNFVFGNKIHVIGGENSLDIPVDTHEIYDTTTNTWSIGIPLPAAHGGSGSFVIGNKGYILGGVTSAMVPGSEVYVYDNTANSWSQVGNLPLPLWLPFIGSTTDGTLGYTFGGIISQQSLPTNVAYSYNPTTDTWTQLANMPDSLAESHAQYYNGKIYILGGINFTGKNQKATYIYDIATNSYSQGTDLLYDAVISSKFINNGKIYLAGGIDNNLYSISNVEIYDIATNTFSRDISLIHSRNSATGAFCNGHGYVIGGININNDFGTFGYNEQYNFS